MSTWKPGSRGRPPAWAIEKGLVTSKTVTKSPIKTVKTMNKTVSKDSPIKKNTWRPGLWGHLFVISCTALLVMADTVGEGLQPLPAPQPSSGVDRSGRDGCGIDEGDGGAEPRATGVLARSLAGPSHCAHSRQLCRSSCVARVAHICE